MAGGSKIAKNMFTWFVNDPKHNGVSLIKNLQRLLKKNKKSKYIYLLVFQAKMTQGAPKYAIHASDDGVLPVKLFFPGEWFKKTIQEQVFS